MMETTNKAVFLGYKWSPGEVAKGVSTAAARGQWGEGKFQYVTVYFPDEADADGKPLQPELPLPGR